MTPELATRWHTHMHECLAAERWAFAEDLTYAPGRPDQEPVPVLNTHDALWYTVWLHVRGYITTEEYRWLKADIARARQEEET
jgi:hypothetical protein